MKIIQQCVLKQHFLNLKTCNALSFHRISRTMSNSNVVLVSGARTPIGSLNGSLKNIPATELGSIAIRAAYERANLKPDEIDSVYMGHVLQSNCKQAPTRQAAIGAGLPFSTECTSINKLCASGLKSVSVACQEISLGHQDVVIAGGMESMSNAPFLVPRTAPKYGGQIMVDSITHDGLTCAINGIHMGQCTEKLIKKFKITREDQDNYCLDSYHKALQATKSLLLEKEIVPVPIRAKNETHYIKVDEEPSKFVEDKILKLKPVFEKDGTITAANASKLNDGAAAVVLMSEETAQSKNIKPIAKVIAYSDGATDPVEFGFAPSISMKKALERANLEVSDIHLWEINEAFSAVPLVNMKELGMDPTKVNIDGGAVALGHPVGMSGTRILLHLMHRLAKDQIGVASICNGGGGSTTMIIQKL